MKKTIESFFLGILAALGALVAEAVLAPLGSWKNLAGLAAWKFSLNFLLWSAVVEEFFKYILIYKRIRPLLFRNTVMLNSAFLGLGFALTEVFLIYSKGELDLNRNIVGISGIIFVHIITSLLAGYIISGEERKKWKVFAWVIVVNSSMHFLYNWLVWQKIF